MVAIDLHEYALDLAISLIRIDSITPAQGAIFDFVHSQLIGFEREDFVYNYDADRLVYNTVFYISGCRDDRPSLCFGGHLDVVPTGNGWTHEPFNPLIVDGLLYGRGAVDMKSSVACFIAAARKAQEEELIGDIWIILTGDEESGPHNSMSHIVDTLLSRGQAFDLCIVGEPTSEEYLGDMMKVGRRGSCNFDLNVFGKQGHVAYPHKSANPINKMPDLLKVLRDLDFDSGSDQFQPSHLEITNIDSANHARNVIPGSVHVQFNIRFNNLQTPESLHARIAEACGEVLSGGHYDLEYSTGAYPFISPESGHIESVRAIIKNVTGHEPELSTSGGTSDARHLYKMGPVIEFGPLNNTAHAVDEFISVDDLYTLSDAYYSIITELM